MRAGRLVSLLRLLQSGSRLTARRLAEELEVSERTILRDIEALSGAGVPVYAVRGAGGGFELLGHVDDLPPLRGDRGVGGGSQRARVRLSPQGRQLATLVGRPADVRVRTRALMPPERADWVEASVLIESIDSAVLDFLALGAEVEVLRPLELRHELAETALRIAELHSPSR